MDDTRLPEDMSPAHQGVLGTQFTCFTGTVVQKLTQEMLEDTGALMLRRVAAEKQRLAAAVQHLQEALQQVVSEALSCQCVRPSATSV